LIILRPPCEIVTQSFLPLIRGLVARKLKASMTQEEIAAKMGVSQPTISSYLKSLVKFEQSNNEYLAHPKIEQLVTNISQMIKEDASPEKVIRAICTVCIEFRISGVTCREHYTNFSSLQKGCQGCLPFLETKILEERKKVLSLLNKAISKIESSSTFVKLLPQVLTNLCQSISEPKTIDDVAAIPGRITKIRKKARVLLPPEFGVSNYTATILLTVNSIVPQIKSAMGFIYNKDIYAILQRLSLSVIQVQNQQFEDALFQVKNESNMNKNIELFTFPRCFCRKVKSSIFLFMLDSFFT
jgi:hypothetical protein